MSDGILNKLRNLDAYGKVNEDFFTRTLSGGVITLVSSIIMFLLFVSELRLFLTLHTANELSVDTSRGEKLEINVDFTFPRMPCGWMSLDVMDVSGEQELDVEHDIHKQRLSPEGHKVGERQKHEVGPSKAAMNVTGNSTIPACGSCYGSAIDGVCCNTCGEVRDAYRKKGWAFTNTDKMEQCEREGFVDSVKEQMGEGCHMVGKLLVNKVAGNFHIAPGKSFQQGNMHIHDLAPFTDKNFDMSHIINELSFGQPYPGIKNPLNGITVEQKSLQNPSGNTGMFQYFLRVVPTIYTDIRNVTVATNQYSVTEYFKGSGNVIPGSSLPGVFCFFDLSPIKVRLTEKRSSFMQFLTSACAIVGGVFTMSGIVDAFVFHGQQVIRKKMDLGKFQ